MPPTNIPKPANAAAASKERDELARFIVDEILNGDLDADDLGEAINNLIHNGREALKRAGYTVREEAHHD